MNKPKVYLAGGFKSQWSDIVKNAVSDLDFYDPRLKEYKNGVRIEMDVVKYGQWDLFHIKQSDIVFVYVERTNTSCIGLSCEAGYAYGLGKLVITVLEPNHETIKDSHLSFITQVSSIVFETLEEGIKYLKTYSNIG